MNKAKVASLNVLEHNMSACVPHQPAAAAAELTDADAAAAAAVAARCAEAAAAAAADLTLLLLLFLLLLFRPFPPAAHKEWVRNCTMQAEHGKAAF